MIRPIRHLVFVLLSLVGTALYAQKTDVTTTVPQVKIAGTQVLSITSSITNEKYDLYVNLPRNYGDTSKTFPVAYLLDAQWDFPLVQAIYGSQYYDGFVPSMVVVGITWSGENANADSLRAVDFTPTQVGYGPQTGGGPKFLQFIKTELIPFIESKYRVNNDRTLTGSSLGGLFTLYTLFHETTLFKRYVLTSPVLSWDNGVPYSYEKDFAEKKMAIPARVFMGVGAYEDTTTFLNFVQLLKSRNYPGLSLEGRVLPGVGHSGTKALGYTWGLQSVFEPPAYRIEPPTLEQCVGTYRGPMGDTFRLTAEGDHLVTMLPGMGKVSLYAEDDSHFYARGFLLRVHFERNGDGKVTSARFEMYSGSGTVQKID